MPKPIVDPARPSYFAASAAAFEIVSFLAAVASVGLAAEPAMNEPIEFETAPSALLRDSVDVLSIAVDIQGEHFFAGFYDGSVMMLDRESR